MWSISQSSFVAMGVCQHSYGESIYSTRHQYCYSYTYYTIVFRYHTKDLQHTLHSLVALQDGDSVNHFKRPVKRFGKLEAFLELNLSEQIRFCC